MRRVAVIGAGAAGSMAAISASSAGAQTLLFERTEDGGRKILISGVVVRRDLMAVFGGIRAGKMPFSVAILVEKNFAGIERRSRRLAS